MIIQQLNKKFNDGHDTPAAPANPANDTELSAHPHGLTASEMVAGDLEALEQMRCQLDMMGRKRNRTVDGCANGALDIDVSSAVCLVHFNLELRELLDHMNRLLQSNRQRCTQADSMAERLGRLQKRAM